MTTTPTTPLRVLVIGNFSVPGCGIRNFADLTAGGLQRSGGLSVDTWDATYDLIYARRERQEPTYLPSNWLSYDVIHLNWHPIALNTYNPEHFPWRKGEGPLLSVYLNDVPPHSGCPIAERAEVVVAPEAWPSIINTLVDPEAPFVPNGPDLLLVYPIPDWVMDLPEPDPEFTVGWSGVRGDGAAELRGICETHGWAMNMTEPAGERARPWASVDDEIRRLARSTVNVCWYHEQRGISGTPSMVLGARRPLLLNDSRMFTPWQNEAYRFDIWNYAAPWTLEQALLDVSGAWRAGTLRVPGPTLYTDHSWTTAAHRLTAAWRAALEAR